MSPSVEEPVTIGHFSTTSGRVVVCDGAYADLWRPGAPTDDGVELEIVGEDAFEAGMLFDLSSHPLYLYDVSPATLEDLYASFQNLVTDAGLSARVEVLESRIDHPSRLDLHFESGQPTHGIEFDGVWSGAADSIPTRQRFPVRAQAFHHASDFAGRWKDVWIEVTREPVVRSELRGYAAVDCGSMLFIDPAVLGEWAEGTPTGQSVSYLSATAAADSDSNNATTLPFGEAEALFFENRWGDGLFEIYADFDSDNSLARVRAAVGSERTQERYLSVMEQAASTDADSNLALVSRLVLEGEAPRFVYRAEPDHERDSGWRILEGGESDEFIQDTENVGVALLRDVLLYHESISPLLASPSGAVFERDDSDSPWREVSNWEPNE